MRMVSAMFAMGVAIAGWEIPVHAGEARRALPARVIDVHLHGYEADAVNEAGPYYGIDAAARDEPTPPNGAAHRQATLTAMERNHIVLGIVSASGGSDDLTVARQWAGKPGPRILAGVTERPMAHGVAPEKLAASFDDGTYFLLGEVGLQYRGATLDEERFEPYLAMAEKKGIPVAVHTGLGPPEMARTVAPEFRIEAGNPIQLEKVLIRHPNLKIWAMHSGFPWDAEMFAIMQQFTNVYVDISPLPWMMSQEIVDRRLKWLLDWGMGKRIMFGTDQMYWPQAIDAAVAAIENSTVLTRQQKDDIFYNNAVRFFGADRLNLPD